MKKQLALIALASIVTIIAISSGGCKKDTPTAPTACVTIASDSVLANQTVAFSSCTSGASSYAWEFGDGGTGTGSATTHVYTTAGIYHGTLTVTGSNGLTNAKTFTMVVGKAGGVWKFKGATLVSDTTIVDAPNNEIYAQSGNAGMLVFFNLTPTTSGTFTVVSGTSSFLNPNEAVVEVAPDVNNSSNYYYSTGGNGQQKVHVTVTNGKITVDASGIEVVNTITASDSTAMNLHLVQQN